MLKFRNKYRIESNRLKIWDYSNVWWYYVTICTKGKINHFGKVENGKMVLNEIGKIARNCWIKIPDHNRGTELDEFVIMPNHVHGIIIIDCRRSIERLYEAPQILQIFIDNRFMVVFYPEIVDETFEINFLYYSKNY
jgi:hypothetical protein